MSRIQSISSTLENLAKKNPKLWDTPLSDGYSPIFSAAHQRQNQALYWLADHYPFLLNKEESWSEFREVKITLFGICAERGNLEALNGYIKKTLVLFLRLQMVARLFMRQL